MLIRKLPLSNQDHNVDLLGEGGPQVGSEWDNIETLLLFVPSDWAP